MKDLKIDESKNYEISIICPSPKGRKIAFKLQKELNGNLYIKLNEDIVKKDFSNIISNGTDEKFYNDRTYVYYEDFNLIEITKKAMKNSSGIVFISSTGIAVRAIAKFLENKSVDPGVVVVDLASKYAINILSGHLGGGNDLTLKVSQILKCLPIITTASDNLGLIAPDILAKNNGLLIDNLKKAKNIASFLIEGKLIGVKDDYNIISISKGYRKIEKLENDCIWITNKLKDDFSENIDYSRVLRLLPKNIILGIGCKRGTPYEKIKNFVNESFIKFNFDMKSICKIVSINIKSNENGIIKLSEELNCPFLTFNKDEINNVEEKYTKSDFVFKTLGVYGVCEPCVYLAKGRVIVSKIKKEGITLSIGIVRI